MNTNLMREKLRSVIQLAAELMSMLPDEPTRPHLVLVKGGDEDLPNMTMPSRAREGISILCDTPKDDPGVLPFRVESGEGQTKQSSLIEEVKAMLISLNIKGSVRERRGGLLEFRSTQFGSVYGRSEVELRTKLERKISEWKPQPTRKRKPKAPLLSEFFEEKYLPYKRNQKIAETTLKNYSYNIGHIIKAGFNKRLNEYTPQQIENFLYSIPQTRKRQIMQGFLNNMFKRAYTLSLVKANPCDRLEHVAHTQTTGTTFSLTELKEFFGTLYSSSLSLEKKLYLTFVFLTGTRRCEALGVGACHVNRTEKILHIPGTKTELSDRDIPLTPMVEKLLDKFDISEGLFFQHSENWADRAFKDISKGHKLHDLRHTYGTLKVYCEKLDIKTVSILLGHSDIKTTLKYYTHPESLDKGTFLRGDLSEEQKLEKMRQKQAEIHAVIDAFLDAVPIFVPKKTKK